MALQPSISYARFLPPTDKRTSAEAFQALRDEFMEAALCDPARTVRTPDHDKPRETVAELIYDSFAGREGDQKLLNAMRIISLAAKGSGPNVSAAALSFLRQFADEHAAFHCDELSRQIEGTEE
jgi:hypothetical protein